jgi:hypothetical protein
LQRNALKHKTQSRSQSQTTIFEAVTGYIAIVYEDHWWPGYVFEKYEENEELNIRFLHPHGPPASFVFPSKPDELIVPVSLVLSMVTPSSDIGRTYKLASTEVNHISKLLEEFKMM